MSTGNPIFSAIMFSPWLWSHVVRLSCIWFRFKPHERERSFLLRKRRAIILILWRNDSIGAIKSVKIFFQSFFWPIVYRERREEKVFCRLSFSPRLSLFCFFLHQMFSFYDVFRWNSHWSDIQCLKFKVEASRRIKFQWNMFVISEHWLFVHLC